MVVVVVVLLVYRQTTPDGLELYLYWRCLLVWLELVVVLLNISTRTLPFPLASRLRLATPASSEPAAAASTGQTRREVCAGTVYGT